MASILNSAEQMSKLDPSNGLASLEQLGSQIKQVWDETSTLTKPLTL